MFYTEHAILEITFIKIMLMMENLFIYPQIIYTNIIKNWRRKLKSLFETGSNLSRKALAIKYHTATNVSISEKYY